MCYYVDKLASVAKATKEADRFTRAAWKSSIKCFGISMKVLAK